MTAARARFRDISVGLERVDFRGEVWGRHDGARAQSGVLLGQFYDLMAAGNIR